MEHLLNIIAALLNAEYEAMKIIGGQIGRQSGCHSTQKLWVEYSTPREDYRALMSDL
jgi:hypothetical protein